MLGGGLLLICAIPVAHLKSTADDRTKRLSEDSLVDPFVVGFSPDLTNKYSPGIAQSAEPSLYIKTESKEEKFSRSSVEAAPDSLPTASFTLPAFRTSLPLTRSNTAVSPFYRGNIESGAIHYQGPTQYSQKSEPLRFYGAAKWQNSALPVLSTVPHSQIPTQLAPKPEESQGYYYGAAKQEYAHRFAPLPTGQVYHPVRQSVEARPDLGPETSQPLVEQARFMDVDFTEKKDISDLRKFYITEHGKKFRQSRPHGHARKEYPHEVKTIEPSKFKIVCYYGSWSVYRPEPLNFGVKDIDPFSCTHLIYSFAGLNPDNLTIVSLDYEEDIVKGSYKSAVGLKQKNPNLKVMLAIGGWNEGGKTYSAMAKTSESRALFIESVVDFLKKHNFDGFDLDWEYPGASDRDGGWGDKENFANLVEELSKAFQPHKWLLSAAVSPAKFRVNDGYDVKKIAEYLDFINVMTYDLHGSWDNAADHHAPLHRRDHDDWDPLTTDGGITYWHKKGAPLNKLLLGTPFYGRSFTLTTGNTAPGAASSGKGGAPGNYTAEEGFLAYFEVCALLKEGGWTEETDSDGNPYMHKGNQWIGYDTVSSIKRKMEYVQNKKLGGAMIWAIDLDDYRGDCGNKWPLLSQMNLELRPFGTELGVEIEDGVFVESEKPTVTAPLIETVETAPSIEAVEAESDNEDNSVSDNEEESAINFECPGAGLHPSQTNCADYYQCLEDGTSFIFHCADGLFYDPAITACNWPESVKCAAPTDVTIYKDRVCQSLDDGLFSDPHRSNEFFWCINEQRQRMSCSYGLHFDSFTGLCKTANEARFHNGVIVKVRNAATAKKSSPLTKAKSGKKVICYFSNWAGLRDGDGKFIPENVDATLCSHVVYAFAKLDEESLTLTPSGPRSDLDDGYYNRLQSVVKKQNPDAKVLISVGGWADSAGDKYSRLVNSEKARANFVMKAVEFLKLYGFEGLVMEWHFPVCWQSDCSKGPNSDRHGFASLAEALQEAFNPHDYSVGATLSGYKQVIDVAYDVKRLGDALDFMNIMTYDFRGFWDGKTGHHAPLYVDNGDTNTDYNTNSVMSYYESKGAPKSKLIVGIPFYGQSFSTRGGGTSYGAEALGPGEAGRWTKQRGMLAFYEICGKVKDGWTKVDGNNNYGPYAHSAADKQWVGYDDVNSIARKAEYVNIKDYGGAAVWTLDLDDFNNICCLGPSPLLNILSEVLRGVGSTRGGCGRPDTPVTPAPTRVETTTYDDGSENGGWKPDPPKVEPAPPRVEPVVAETTRRPTTTTRRPTTTTRRPTTTTRATTTSTSNYDDGSWKPDQPSVEPVVAETTRRPTTEASGSQKHCIEGLYYDYPKDCQKYYRCVIGKLVLQACAGGLFWNSDAGMCDWVDKVQCNLRDHYDDEKDAIIIEDSTVEDKFDVEIIDVDNSVVGGCNEGEYTPAQNECSSYNQCVNGEKVLQKCNTGLHWNKGKQVCDWPKDAGCEFIKVATAKDGGCEEGFMRNHPSDCSKYLFCVHSKFEPFSCKDGTYWDNNLKVCNFPDQVICRSESDDPLSESVEAQPEAVEAVPELPQEAVIAEWEEPERPSSTSTTETNDGDSGDYDYQGEWKPSTTSTTKRPDWGSVPLQGPLTGDYKVVCYFTNWAWYRPGAGKYRAEDIDPTLCTHIIYGFAVLDYSNLLIKPHDTWADIDNEYYKKVTEYQKYGIKVTVAIGGWNDSEGDKYSRLVNDPAARKKFIDHVLQFIEKYNFDGLDLDWEYPSCWQTECKEERYKDKGSFAAFVSELKTAFRPRGLLLSAAVSPSKKIIDVGYDVPSIARDLDWINVMTYDYHGHWDRKTGHVAPFYAHPEDDFSYFNMNFTMHYWMKAGAPAKKLVLGMPLYGQAFTLDNDNEHGLNAPARQKGQAGEFTRAAGFLAYYEICSSINQGGWTVVNDPEGRMGPYAYKDSQWVGFDDVAMIRRKSEFVRELGLGGGMVWALDLDDFNNKCGQGKYPLMNTIKAVLGPAQGQYAPTKNAEKMLSQQEEEESTEDSDSSDQSTLDETEIDLPTSPIVADPADEIPNILQGLPGLIGETAVNPIAAGVVAESDYKVVCYFTNWAWYRPGQGKYKPEDIDSELCTHIVYGFAVLDANTLTIKAHDSWADFDNAFYKKVTSLKSKNKKVLLALGGWNDSAGKKYSKLVNNPASRKAFISHAVEFLTGNSFDGLDLDWEYPKCWQVDCSKGPESDKESFALWIKELHFAFKPLGLLLTAAVSPSNKVMDAGYDIPALDNYLDYVSVMTYDYHGQWDKQTGHVAPMYQHEEDENIYFNTNFTVHYWLQGGLRRSKLIMGMPMYGQSFTLKSTAENGLNSQSNGGGTAGEFTRAKGFLAYYEICDLVQNKGWKVVHDPTGSMGPYAYKGTQWVSFDDSKMIQYKSQYVKNMGLGGAMIWALDLDDFRNKCGCEAHPLLKTINRELRDFSQGSKDCNFPGNYRLNSIELSPSPYSTCTRGNFAQVAGKCAKYLVCNNGDYEEHNCPHGLHWNRDRCDWPDSAGCEEPEALPIKPETLPIELETSPIIADIEDNPHFEIEEEIAEVVEPVKVPEGIIVPNTGMKVVCYYTNWAFYRQGSGKYMPEDIDYTLCTHINYGFAVLDPTQLVMVPHDDWADIQKNFLGKVAALKEKGVTVSVAIGGWNDSEGDKYSRMVNSQASRAKFISEAIKFIEKWGFEGLDLDWEYPKCWQVDCSKGPDSDKESFSALVKELSAEFKPRGWSLSAAVSPSKSVMDAGYDIPTLNSYLDIINVMSYDYHGHWDKKTGHVAPLYERPDDDYYFFNANYTMHYWAEKGADKEKLVMGMPMYGQSFTLADNSENTLNSAVVGRGEAGEFTRAGGFLAYYEICKKIKSGGWTVVRDPESRHGPYAYSEDQWVGYDDISMIRQKSQFVKDYGFGGGMIWALDLDDFANQCGCENYPLLRTINRVLRDYPLQEPDCESPRTSLPYSFSEDYLTINIGELDL